MFVTEKLVFIHLQKTAGSHIIRLLRETIGGNQQGRHNPAGKELINSSRTLMASIRNPWDWYVSLWRYGCDNKGGFHKTVTTRSPLNLRYARHPAGFARLVRHELVKRTRSWEQVYLDSSSPELFQRWLSMIYDPSYRYDFGEGYGESSCYKFVGLYTYRYLMLCCRNANQLNTKTFNSLDDLREFDRKNGYISAWIRNERLEEDFVKAVSDAGEVLTPDDLVLINSAKKTNRSSGNQPSGFFYDYASMNLVREKEALIIDRFAYTV